MIKKGSDEFNRLLKLGYPQEMVILALKESKSKFFDDVCDLLHFREAHYQKILQINQKDAILDKKKGKKSKKKNQDQEEEKKTYVVPVQVMQVAFGQKPQKAELKLKIKGDEVNVVEKGGLPEQEDEKKDKKDKKKPVVDKIRHEPKKMWNDLVETNSKRSDGGREEVLAYLKKQKKDLTRENVDDSNELVDKLVDYLEEMKMGTSNTMSSLRRYLAMPREFPFVLELKNMIFSVLIKILSPKMNDTVPVDQRSLEYCLSNVFEMRLLSSKQMGTITNSCRDLYEKLEYPTDAEIFDKLEEFMFYEDMGLSAPADPEQEQEKKGKSQKDKENDQVIDWDEGEAGQKKKKVSEEQKKVSEEQKKKLIAKARAKEKWRESQEERERVDEERKYELIVQLMKNKSRQEAIEKDIEVNNSSSEDEKEGMKPNVMEECLICMENIREVVFLPCSHFLTCSLCSPRVEKCPLCYKGIEENLKIYWS